MMADEKHLHRTELPPALADRLWENVPAHVTSCGTTIAVAVPKAIVCFSARNDELVETEMPDFSWQEDTARPLRAVVWKSEADQRGFNCAGITPDGRLRMNWGASSREMNLNEALGGAVAEALLKVPTENTAFHTFIVLGQGGVAVQVDTNENAKPNDGKTEVYTLWRGYQTTLNSSGGSSVSTAPSGLTGIFARALGLQPSTRVREDLSKPIVSAIAGSSFVVAVRAGGRIERWAVKPESSSSSTWQKRLQWELNLFSITAPPAEGQSQSVVDACDLGDERIAVVVLTRVEGRVNTSTVVLETAESGPPVSIEFQSSIGSESRRELPTYYEGKQYSISFSGGICYLIDAYEGVVHWTSFTSGLRLEQQVRGKIENIWGANQTCALVGVCDIENIHNGSSPGGTIAIIARDQLAVVSARVPPPLEPGWLSTQEKGPTDTQQANASEVVKRAFLQLLAGQLEAARATLSEPCSRALSGDLHTREALSRKLVTLSDDILSAAETNLLVDDLLRKKNQRHRILMQALVESSLIDNSSYLWQLLDFNSKRKLISNCEKLEAAVRVRETENDFSRAESEDPEPEGSRFLASVAKKASHSKDGSDLATADDNRGIRLYRDLTNFHKYLPVVEDTLRQQVTEFNGQSENAGANSSKVILAAAHVTLACAAGAEDVRVEAENRLQTQELDRKGGWSCSGPYIKLLQTVTNYVAEIHKFTIVTNNDVTTELGYRLVQAQLSMCRRSMDRSKFERHRSEVLSKFNKQFESPPDVLALAEEFEDFEKMMETMWNASDEEFERFLVEAVEKFPDSFTNFCFSYLEKKGAYERLLSRPPDQMELLDEWFAKNPQVGGHIRWMHELHLRRFDKAGSVAFAQAKAITASGERGSLSSAKSLLSIAKLNLHVAGSTDEMGAVEQKLYLISAQERLGLAAEHLVPTKELVEQCFKKVLIESTDLAMHVGIALEIVENGNLSLPESNELRDYVWLESIVREEGQWKKIAESASDGVVMLSDDDLRRRLEGTAFYLAVVWTESQAEEMQELIGRQSNGLDRLATRLNTNGGLLKSLMETAVQLANDADASETL